MGPPGAAPPSLHADNCPNCGAALPLAGPDGSVVCRYCGTKFTPSAPQAPPPTPAAAAAAPSVTFVLGSGTTGSPPQKTSRKGKVAIAVFVVGIILVTTILPLYFSGVLSLPLSVHASISPGTGTHPLQVNYQASASGGQGPYTYTWDFGDGGGSSTSSGTYSYAQEGLYTATVTVNDNTGNQATQTISETVLGALSSSPISQVVNVSLPSGIGNAQDFTLYVPTIGPVSTVGSAQNASVSVYFQDLGCTGGASQASCDKVEVAVMTNLQYNQFTSGATVTPLWCAQPTGASACAAMTTDSAQVNVSAQSGQSLNLVVWDTYAGAVTTFVNENFQLYQIS